MQPPADSPPGAAEPMAVPPAPAPPAPGTPTPAVTAKPRTDAGFFILGLFTPILAYIAFMTLITMLMPSSNVAFGAIGFPVALFLVFLWLFIVGQRKNDVRLRSFGKGGLWSCAGVPLLTMLAFGTCMVAGLTG